MLGALYKIKQSLKTQNDAQANIKAMTLHATSFGLYMLGVVLLSRRILRLGSDDYFSPMY